MGLGNVGLKGYESALNSSATPLGAAGVFTGTFERIADFSGFTLTIFSDVASASNGLEIHWSHNGSDVDRIETTNLKAGIGRAFNFSARGLYFRIKYTNGATPQSIFRLGVILHRNAPGFITKPLIGSVDGDNFALLTQSATMARLNNGTYTNVAGISADGVSVLGTSEIYPLFADRGQAFEITTDSASTGTTSETPFLYVNNPAGSGKVMRIEKMTLGLPTTGNATYRAYINPTITANGTQITPVGARQTGQNAAVGLWYSLPTASAFGTKFLMIRVDSSGMPFDNDWNSGRLIEPGNRMLITVVQSVASQSGHISVQFSEV